MRKKASIASIGCGVLAALLLIAVTGRAQSDVEDAVKQLSSDNVRGYVQPFVNSFGSNMNSGLYHTAAVDPNGFHLQIGVIGMGTLIGDAEKVYQATSPYSSGGVETATLFGGLGSEVTDSNSGLSYHFQNGQVKTSIVGLAAPQLTIGSVYGTQAIVRYFPSPSVNDFPKVTLFGIGVQHNLNQYLPTFPADLAASLAWQKLDIGDIFEAKAFNIGAQISKSWAVLTLYGGLQYETSSMSLDYTYTGQGSTPNTKIHVDIDGEQHFRATGGLTLDLLILHLNGDVNLGKVTTFSAGLGVGL